MFSRHTKKKMAQVLAEKWYVAPMKSSSRGLMQVNEIGAGFVWSSNLAVLVSAALSKAAVLLKAVVFFYPSVFSCLSSQRVSHSTQKYECNKYERKRAKELMWEPPFIHFLQKR